jgi:hypothetical protein
MTNRKKHVVILPYFCDEEVDRYVQLSQLMQRFPAPSVEVDFLLASSPRAETSTELAKAYEPLGNVIPFACPTRIFGYPEGPTAMFWDCMDYMAQNYSGNDGFSLWLESDMAPAKPDWIDRLSDEWYSESQTPVMMGCYVPEVYKQRIFKQPKLLLEPHINGGACYSMDFASKMPAEAREGVFDMAVYKYATDVGRAKKTGQIAFSTQSRVRRDLVDDDKALLHGFMQEKDAFIDACVEPLTEQEIEAAKWNGIKDRIETAQRRLRVWVVRRGHKAMLENMFLAKQKYETQNPHQFRPGKSTSTTVPVDQRKAA